MVYLPGALNQRRSQQASDLYADQSQMGVTPPPAPTPAPAGGGGAGGIPTGGGAQSPQQGQPSRLTEYFRQQQQQKQMVVARGQDLQLAQMFMHVLDPSMPKGFRQLGLRQISQQLGVDPRGDKAKEIINTISGLDPQSLEGLRRGLGTAVDQGEPGDITNMARGILTGSVPPDQFLSLARSALQPGGGAGADTSSIDTTAAATPSGGGGFDEGSGPMMLGGPGPDSNLDASLVQPVQYLPGGTASGQPNMPGQSAAPPVRGPAQMPGAASPVTDVPQVNQNTVPARMREVTPELANFLGLDMDQRYRVIDVMKAGWNRIPSDDADQRKLVEAGRNAQNGIVDTITMASQLAALVRGRPEALDVSVWLPYLGTIGVNPSSAGSKVGSFLEGLGNTVGIRIRGDNEEGGAAGWLGRWAQETASRPENQAFAERMAAKFTNWVRETGQGISDTAELSARINSLMVPLAFAMASAKGQTGRFLSDRDVEFQLRELGSSNNPQQFIAAITDMVARLNTQYDTKMRSITGAPVPIASVISPEVADIVRAGGVAPATLLSQLGPGTGSAAPPPSTTPTRTTSQPQTQVPPPVSGGGWGLDIGGGREAMPPGPNPSASVPSPAPSVTTPLTAPATQVPTPPAPAPGGRTQIPQSSPTIAAEENAALGRLAEDRAARLEQRDQERRRLQLAESAEARAARNEAEQRRLHIQQAFANIGRALSGAISVNPGGGAGGGGSDQDPNAFRISPLPQRRAPTPQPAAPQALRPRRK